MTTHNSEKQILLKEIKDNHDSGLFSALAGWITKSAKEKIVLKGSAEQVSVVQEAMVSTREFHESLQDSSADLTIITEKLQKKHECAAKFERTFGVTWIL